MPKTDSNTKTDKPWLPPMGPTQEKAFWDNSPYVLMHGERGSGKSFVALHKVVKHCYENRDALAMVVTLTRAGSNAGGSWEDLISDEEDINTGEPAGILAIWAKGIGLEYSPEYSDVSKVKWIDVRSRDGGVSRIMQLSLPTPSLIKDRAKNFKPSLFLFEELTNTYDPDYFVKIIQQLGRRRSVPARNQQYLATCNPADEGKDHWVYKYFFEYPKGVDKKTGRPTWDSEYSVYHIPMTENLWMEDKEGYIKKVLQDCKRDPTAYDRLIEGKWIAKVVGSGIFEGYYSEVDHRKGIPGKTGLMPKAYEGGVLNPIIIGYDPGSVNNARVFLQRHLLDGKWVWRVFDEVIDVSKKKHYNEIIRAVLEKMVYWNNKLGENMPYIHIGDEAMITHFNPQGSYDYKKFYEISKMLIDTTEKFKGLQPIRIIAPDKGSGSQGERVRCVQNYLSTNDIMISALCTDCNRMFRELKRAKGRNGEEQEHTPLKDYKGHIHTFDALSYPMYYYEFKFRKRHVTQNSKKELEVTSFSK